MSALSGKRIMLLEDEFLIALDTSRALESLGAEVVGPVHRLDKALALAQSEPLDAAVLDVDIGGVKSDAVADALKARNIPFVRATGYGASEPQEGGVPTLDKPYDAGKLRLALLQAMAAGG